MRIRLSVILLTAFMLALGARALGEGDAGAVSRYALEGDALNSTHTEILDEQGPDIFIEFKGDSYGVELALCEEIDIETFELTRARRLYAAGVVRAGQGFTVRAYLPDVLPNLRLSFVNRAGAIERYYISESGEDGSVILIPAPASGVSEYEAEGLLLARLGEADPETGFTFSYGLIGETEYMGKACYAFRMSWLVMDEGGGAHMSYLDDVYVSIADGEIMLKGGEAAPDPDARAYDDWAIAQALNMATRMARLASDEAYIAFYTVSSELTDTVASASALSDAALVSARVIDMPARDDMHALLSMLGARDALSDEVVTVLYRRLPVALPNLINAQYGSTFVAASAILRADQAYTAPLDFKPQIVILDFGLELCAICALAECGDGIINVSATILPSAAIDALNSLPFGTGFTARVYEY